MLNKILIDDAIPFIKGVFEPYAEVVYKEGGAITNSDLCDVDVLIVRTRTMCDETLLKGTSVKLIGTATIGTDHIDTKYCDNNDIAWFNCKGCNSNSVVNYVGASILSWIDYLWEEIKKGLGLPKDMPIDTFYKNYSTTNTIGIVGVGAIGSKVEILAKELGFKVLVCDPFRAEEEGSDRYVDFDYLVANSNIITVHTPLTKGGRYPTYHLFDEEVFEKMQTETLLINSSRGEVVSNEACLKSKDAIFILDVWENEPNIDLQLLERAFIATPHIAGYSKDGKANATTMAVQAVANHFDIDALKDFVAELPKYNTIAKELKASIKESYPILEDSEKLKANPADFELFRKNYWQRRDSLILN